MFCCHFVYIHVFSLQKAISFIQRKGIHPPCSVVVSSLDYVISKYLFYQSNSKLVLQCWGGHGRSLAYQIFVRLREKKKPQPVSLKRL